MKKKRIIKKIIDRMTGRDREEMLMEARVAKERGDYQTALSLYAKCKDYKSAGKIAEQLGNDSLAIKFYEEQARNFYTDEPIEIEDAARLYHKHGLLGKAFELYSEREYYDKAGEIAEEMGDSNSAIKMYKEAIKNLESKPEKVRNEKKISLFKEKIKKLDNKKPDGLASRLDLSILVLMGLGGVFFLSSNLTGNVISSATQFDYNIIGAILFISGIVGSFLWFKNSKK